MKKRLLLVDDDINILQGLKRMLKPFRREWEVITAESGADALKIMESDPIDCIVSDMRMPGINGADLLSKVQEEYPGTARFILSGHSESEAIIEAVPVTHQFLSKPCESDKLVETVKRACELHSLVEDEHLQEIIGKVDSLPSRPEIYNKLTRLIANENSDIADISELIEQDPSITAKVIQIVNSAFFGLARSISSTQDALSYLGISTLKSLILSKALFSSVDPQNNISGFSLDAEYKHSLLSATIAKELFTNKREAEDAFMAGMLQNAGNLILAQFLPEKFKEIIQQCQSTDKTRNEIEMEIVGASQAKIGAYLLGLWGLPYPIIEAVAYHDTPWEIEHSNFQALDAIYVVNQLLKNIQSKNEDPYAGIDKEYLEKLNVADKLPIWHEIVSEKLGATAEDGNS